MKTVRAKGDRPAERAGGADELLGLMFTTPKELRHRAEQALGALFVPTELVSERADAADLVLRPGGMEVHVHARRERKGYPFRVVRVDTVAR